MSNNNQQHQNPSKDGVSQSKSNSSQQPSASSHQNYHPSVSDWIKFLKSVTDILRNTLESNKQEKPHSDSDIRQTHPPKVVTKKTIDNNISMKTFASNQQLQSNELAPVTTQIFLQMDRSKLYASFNTWPKRNKPPIDRLVRAGLSYTGKKDIVTCFHCHKSIGNWIANDDPLLKHLRNSPHCEYAKQMYERTIHHITMNKSAQEHEKSDFSSLRYKVPLTDSEPSQNEKNMLKIADFEENCECGMLSNQLIELKNTTRDQKQFLEGKDGYRCRNAEECLRIVEESMMKHERIHEPLEESPNKIKNNEEQNQNTTSDRHSNMSNEHHLPSNNNHIVIPISLSSLTNGSTSSRSSLDSISESSATSIIQDEPIPDIPLHSNVNEDDRSNQSASSNNCIICLTEDRQLACLPCGHVSTCVPCGHSLRSCPICRQAIEAFVRIYL